MYYDNKADISTQYDKYYQGGEDSLYNKRFGKKRRVTMREYEILTSHLKNAIYLAKDNIVKIIDFGCGNGRTMPTLYRYAFKFPNYKFEITAYDVSKVGLDELTESLIAEGFEIKTPISQDCCSLTKQNITIKILLGSPDLSTSELEQLFGSNFNLILSIFGVLSHIPGSNERLNILKMFKNIADTNGILLLSLPSYASHKPAIKEFEKLRAHATITTSPNNLHLAQEKGDIYYKISGSEEMYNFYHIYSISEVMQQLQDVGIQDINTGVYSISTPSNICKSRLYTIADYVLSKFCSTALLQTIALTYFAKYFFISSRFNHHE